MNELRNIDTFSLIEELSNRTKEELEYGIFILLFKKKISYEQLSKEYVKTLEAWNQDKDNLFSEACKCVLESFSYKRRTDTDFNKKSVQRALYLLNNSKQFNLQKLNDKYNYNEEEAKKLSWYERNKSNV